MAQVTVLLGNDNQGALWIVVPGKKKGPAFQVSAGLTSQKRTLGFMNDGFMVIELVI